MLLFIYLHVLPGMGDGQTHLSYCLNARLQTRQLPVGDALWLARHKQQEQEYVLDFLVERKRVDDLWSSIKDTRYKQQKLRIMVSSLIQTDWIVTSQLTIWFSTLLHDAVWICVQRCGVRKILYLVEGDPNLMDSAENLKTAYAFEHPHICSFEHSCDTWE